MVRQLRREGVGVGRHRVRRLMRLMGLEAIYQAPRTSAPHPEHRIYPYLLRNLTITRADHVWCADITYIPVRRGFLYLVAIMDWATRQSWRGGCRTPSMRGSASRRWTRLWPNTADPRSSTPTRAASSPALAFTGVLNAARSRESRWTAAGRCLDNVFIERLWRSLKHEAVYLHGLARRPRRRAPSSARGSRSTISRAAALGPRNGPGRLACSLTRLGDLWI